MGRQNLQPKDAPHSFMLAFSGASYPVPPGTNKKLERRVFISFNSVTLRDIQLKNGGFSDDIRIEPGSPTSSQPREFRPNIGGITITGITGVKRPNRGGNSIRFGGLAQNVLISNCALNSLILEVDPDWSTFPGPSPFQPSVWHVSSIQARAISFNANGPVQSLIAQNLTARQSFTVSHATGQILDSRLVLLANDVQFRTLREVLFQNCAFTLPQPSGAVHGIDLQTHDGLPCSVRFKDCSFTNNVGVVSGQLIRTEARSTILSERVTANLENCLYPTAFTHADKTHHVAILNQKGDYTFLKSDFPNSDPSPAIAAPPNTNIVDHGSSLTYHIP
jgi:hypothetical protein